MDQPITIRQLKDALDRVNTRGMTTGIFVRAINDLAGRATTTDYIKISQGGTLNPVYKVAEQPTRRVQVGDLVTVGASFASTLPRVARVTTINVAKPWKVNGLVAVAISPEDADRIQASLGKVS